ncbi:30S ribosomal protein S18, partial [bacterium]|nr:30S ribosomal protein S18 [bacterium]
MLSSRKKSCYFKRNNIHEIDYKDTRLLNKFVNDQGKITPRRVTGTSS